MCFKWCVSIPFSQALDGHLKLDLMINLVSFNSFQLGFRREDEWGNKWFIFKFQFLLVRLQTCYETSRSRRLFTVSIPFSQALDPSSYKSKSSLSACFNSFQLGFRLHLLHLIAHNFLGFNSFQLGFRLVLGVYGLLVGRCFNSFQLGFRQSAYYKKLESIFQFQFLLVRLQTVIE